MPVNLYLAAAKLDQLDHSHRWAVRPPLCAPMGSSLPFFKKCLFLREGETQSWGGGEEREGDTESEAGSRL